MRALHLCAGLFVVLLARAQDEPRNTSERESAATITASGRVSSLDSKVKLLKLRTFDGDKEVAVTVPDRVKMEFKEGNIRQLSDLSEGTPVKVIYRIENGRNVATAVAETEVPAPPKSKEDKEQAEPAARRDPAAAVQQPGAAAASPAVPGTAAPGAVGGVAPGVVFAPGRGAVGRFGQGGGLDGIGDGRGTINGRIMDIRGDVMVVMLGSFGAIDNRNNPGQGQTPNAPGTAPGEINPPNAQKPPVANPPSLSPTPQVPGGLPPTQPPSAAQQQQRQQQAQRTGTAQTPQAQGQQQAVGVNPGLTGEFVVLTTAETNSGTLLHLVRETRVQIDGRPGTLTDLREGMQVSLSVAARNNALVVALINASLTISAPRDPGAPVDPTRPVDPTKPVLDPTRPRPVNPADPRKPTIAPADPTKPVLDRQRPPQKP